jgi:hypothetical protein
VHLVPMLDVPTGLMPLWCLAREHVLYSQADGAYNGFNTVTKCVVVSWDMCVWLSSSVLVLVLQQGPV